MAGKNRRRRKKHKEAGRMAYILLSAVIICAAIVISIALFFRVTEVRVEGAVVCDAQAVAEASGVEKGENLLFIDKVAITRNIFERFTWVRDINIKREAPATVVIKLTESKAVAYTNSDRGIWIMDSGCKLLEKGDAAGIAGLIRIVGAAPLMPKAGDVLSLGENGVLKTQYLQDLLEIIEKRELVSDISHISMTYHTNAQFDYLGRFDVVVGGNTMLEDKFIMLAEVVANLAPNAEGTIDLSNPMEVHFIPA